jgi:hypothetical protein
MVRTSAARTSKAWHTQSLNRRVLRFYERHRINNQVYSDLIKDANELIECRIIYENFQWNSDTLSGIH